MKKLITVILSLLIIIGMVGCNNTSENQQNDVDEYSENDNSSEEISNTWIVGYETDEFGDSTGEKYIINEEAFIGTFSNTATTNSLLGAFIMVYPKYTIIRLAPYGTTLLKSAGIEDYRISIKDSDGNKKELRGKLTDSLMFVYQYPEEAYISDYIKQKLSQGKDLTFYIYNEDRSVENYKFTAISDNFSKLS